MEDVNPNGTEFNAEERALMLHWARQSIEAFVRGQVPEEPASPPPHLVTPRACFVTLMNAGALRGCVGNVQATAPLYRAVFENARAAASRDPRFPPVTPAEVDLLQIELSILETPRRLEFASADELLRQLEPVVTGVLFQAGGRVGTFLPQVWEQIHDREDFMNRLAEKAGFPPDAWRGPDVAVSVYR